MRVSILLCSISLLLSQCHANSKKKSISSATWPWPGFAFQGATTGDDIYEDYSLEEEDDEVTTDNAIENSPKSDYRSTSAFRSGVASAIHDFGFDLYSTMAKNWTSDQNALISPVSVYTALCMLALGLDGNSDAQAMSVLHGDAFNDIHEEMAELADVVFRTNELVTVTKANRIFVDRSIKLFKLFKRRMRQDYGVSAKKVNFQSQPELNRKRINTFVARNTQSKIRNLAPVGSVTSDTRLFIVNAMYMKASWKTAFKSVGTMEFHNSPSTRSKVTMMQVPSGQCHTQINNELNSLVLRMQMNGDVSMVIIMPQNAGDFSLLEDARGKMRIRRVMEEFYDAYMKWPRMCRITMPKFQIKHTANDLIDCLKSMGMTDIFDQYAADLSKMTPGKNLYVSDMRHKATIDVNENGLEASAATSIGVSARSMPHPVNVNKPFMFIVRDDNTGATLFTGKVVKPEYEKL